MANQKNTTKPADTDTAPNDETPVDEVSVLRSENKKNNDLINAMAAQIRELGEKLEAVSDRHKLQKFDESRSNVVPGTRGYVRTNAGRVVTSWRSVRDKVSVDGACVQVTEIGYIDGGSEQLEMVKMMEFDRVPVRIVGSSERGGRKFFTVSRTDAEPGSDDAKEFDIEDKFLN